MGTQSICPEQYVGIWNKLSNCSENLKAELKVFCSKESIDRSLACFAFLNVLLVFM